MIPAAAISERCFEIFDCVAPVAATISPTVSGPKESACRIFRRMGSLSRRNCPATFTSSTSVKTRAVLALNIYHQMIRSSHMYMIEINSKSISPAALAASLRSGDAHELLDVRTLPEYSSAHVPGARLISLGELKAEA